MGPRATEGGAPGGAGGRSEAGGGRRGFGGSLVAGAVAEGPVDEGPVNAGPAGTSGSSGRVVVGGAGFAGGELCAEALGGGAALPFSLLERRRRRRRLPESAINTNTARVNRYKHQKKN